MEKVIFIGDSWGHYLGEAAKKFNTLADINSEPEYEATTVIGSTASRFARNYDGYMDRMTKTVKENRHKLLIFSLGGNDFYNLGHFNDLTTASNDFIEESFSRIEKNLIFVLKEIRALTSAPILFSGYDYFNIELLTDLFTPESLLRKLSTPFFNRLMMKLGRSFAEAAAVVPDARYTVNWGLLQNHADSKRYPLRGGNPDEATPREWIPDGMHPTLEGYRLLLESTLKQGGFLK